MIKLTVVRSLDKFLSSSNMTKQALYSIQMSPFGFMLVVTIEKFLCMLKFMPNLPDDDGLVLAQEKFPFCKCVESQNVKEVLDVSDINNSDVDVQLLVEGTEFFEHVWRTLLTIPQGSTLYYSDVAKHIGKPLATRAVGTAVGKNPIAYLIPCHRVIGKNNNCFKFAAGPEIKKLLLESEGISVTQGSTAGAKKLLEKSGLQLDRPQALYNQG